MKQRHLMRILSATLALLTLLVSIPVTTVTALSSGDDYVESGSGAQSNGEGSNSGSTQSATVENTASTDDFINFANSLANGVNAYFDNGNRDHFYVKNQNMTLEYNLGALDNKQIGSIKNTQGQSYFEETMDVYVKMGGTKYYSNDSIIKSGTNMDMFGYYYYLVNFEDQQFTADFAKAEGGATVTNDLHSDISSVDQMTMSKQTENIKVYNWDGTYRTENNVKTVKATFTGTSDPKINMRSRTYVTNGASDYKYLKVTLKAGTVGTLETRTVQIFYWTSANTGSTEKGSKTLSYIADGQYHDYYFYLGDNRECFTGDFKGARFDFSGKVGETIEIAGMELVNSKVDEIPDQLVLKRHFGVYSDKLNHRAQIVAKNETKNIQEIGVETKIPTADVSKIIVKDASGYHETLDTVDWRTAEYIGFDTPAGIFGYILQADGNNDNIKVEIVDGNYVITQSRTPSGVYREYNAAVNLKKVTGVAVKFTDGSSVDTGKNVNLATITSTLSSLTAEQRRTAESVSLYIAGADGKIGTYTLFLAPYEHPFKSDMAADPISLTDTTLNIRYSYQAVDEDIRNVSKITEIADRRADGIEGTIYTSSYFGRITSGSTFYDRYITHPGIDSNENDFYLGQRLYTDENHTFDAFIKEAEIERHPLTDKNFTIHKDESTLERNAGDGADGYIGYDAWSGAYYLQLDCGGFNDSQYDYPNRHWNIKFSVNSPDDRTIYIFAYSDNGGCLECAALLDDKNMMIPVPIEVAKNFSEGNGERDIFNVNDKTYSYAIFPINAKTDETITLNLVEIQQNWGNYPNSQISSIQFHCPYYHLSTGTTETNCIVPWYSTERSRGLTTLPDHRGWSAPFWKGQPQHNSCGSHRWLTYTDASGYYAASETTSTQVGSYGPIYADLNMDYLTDGGKIKIHYNHMEMPQQDENRGYYEMQYTVLEDIKFSDFKRDFEFYSITDNDGTGVYTRIGYLDENNEFKYARNNYLNYDANGNPYYKAYKLNPNSTGESDKYLDASGKAVKSKSSAAVVQTTIDENGNPTVANCELATSTSGKIIVNNFYNVNTETVSYYVLGDQNPYFSFFDMDNYSSSVNSNATGTAGGYSNLSFIVKDYDLNLENADDVNFAIKNNNNRLALTLDIDGEFTLKAGDTITINAIIMPWGSQEMESYEEYWANDDNDATVDWDYDDVIDDEVGKYLDKNVRDVRQNSCINSFKATTTTDTVVDTPFLARVKSNNGETATFTLSGGENNMAVRVDGFTMLTVPKIYELVDGEWVEYVVSSYNTPDEHYYGYKYDGYGVYLNEDGTYSYAFIVRMDDGAERTFKVEATEEFTGWEGPIEVERPNGLYWVGEGIADAMGSTIGLASKEVLFDTDEDGNVLETYTRLNAAGNASEVSFALSIPANEETGQYLAIKYRVPTTNQNGATYMQIYTSTVYSGASDATDKKNSFNCNLTIDNEWHIALIDLSKYNTASGSYVVGDDGKYFAKFLRIDFIEKASNHTISATDYMDFAFVALCNNKNELLSYDSDAEYVYYHDNSGVVTPVNTADGNLWIGPDVIKSKLGKTDTISSSAAIDSDHKNMPYAHLEVITDKTGEDVFTNVYSASTVYSHAGRYVGILYRSNVSKQITVYMSTQGWDNYNTFKPDGSGNWTFAIVDLGANGLYDDSVGMRNFRLDYLESASNGSYLDLAFVGLFDSVEAAEEYYNYYYVKYVHECRWGAWEYHTAFDGNDVRYCIICGDSDARDAEHLSGEWTSHTLGDNFERTYCVHCGLLIDEVAVECEFDNWIHGAEQDTGSCACGNIQTRPAVHTPGDRIHTSTEDYVKCTECNEIIERYDPQHTYGDRIHTSTEDYVKCTECNEIVERYDPQHTYGSWYHVQGELKEQRTCACGESETRDTKLTGWLSLANYVDRNGDGTVTSGDHLRKGVSAKKVTVSAAALPIVYNESRGGYYLAFNGEWIAINDGVNKLVYRINEGEWIDFATQPNSTTAWGTNYHSSISAAEIDIERSAYHGIVRTNYISFNAYADQTVSLTIGVVPEGNQSVIIPLITYTDIKGPEGYTDGLEFTSNGDGYTVTGYTGSETEVKIPNVYLGAPVTAIAAGAFAGTCVTDIDIPSSITSVDVTAFEGCDINNVTVADENTVYTVIGNCLIENETKLVIAFNEVEIPDGIVTIGSGAFVNYAAAELAIPVSVMTIEEGAFVNCDGLVINYAGSKDEWDNVNKGSDFDLQVIWKGIDVLGDVNHDGVLDVLDVTEIRKYIASKDPATGVATYEISIEKADLNDDGVVTSLDLILIKKLIATQQ